MTIVHGDPIHGALIAGTAGAIFNPEADRVIARVKGKELLGGATYTAYTGASLSMHVAGFVPGWLTPDLLWVGFHYCFVQLGCKIVFGQIPENNAKALEFDLKLGFKEMVRIPDVFPDCGLVVVAMRREECRWLEYKPRRIKEHTDGR